MSNTTLAYILGILFFIGGATVARWLIEGAIGLWRLVREACRSFIQTRRIERINCGRGGRFRPTVFFRTWADLCGRRTDVGAVSPHGRHYDLPYDVRQPITRVW